MGCGLYLISTWVPGRAWLFWVLAGCALQLGLCMFDGWPCRVVAGQLMVYAACFVEDAIAAYVPRFLQVSIILWHVPFLLGPSLFMSLSFLLVLPPPLHCGFAFLASSM